MKLRIEKPIYGGAGLARASEGALAGKAVFVPFALPGELVEARITEDRRGFASAELDEVLKPSAARTTPPCPYFGKCGGCHYQHAVYNQQIEMKTAILRETLERAHVPGAPAISTLHGEPLGYRNRIRLHVQRSPFALCYKKRASHQNLPVTECPITAPGLQEALQVTLRAGTALKLGDMFDEVEFFTNSDQNSVLLSLWTSRTSRNLDEILKRICEFLRREMPALSGAAIFSSQDKQQGRLLAQWGEPALAYTAAGQNYHVSIGSFFQVNRFLIDEVVELVTKGRAGELAWDLYAGVGLFACALAGGFQQVIAVESASSSSDDLQYNLKRTSHRAIESSTLEFLRMQSSKHGGPIPDLVVVDPPRSGLGAEVTSLLAKIKPKQIVYVSCDPATLARDLHGLVQSGYHLKNMHMIDMFPQTYHIESISLLSLG